MILVTGGSGMLGTYLLKELANAGISFESPPRTQLDISSIDSINKFFIGKRYSAIIHLAAETDVDLCERESSRAYLINALATERITKCAEKMNSLMIYISTSAVFGGIHKLRYSELDLPMPLNFYGSSKLHGEYAVRQLSEHLVIRSSWMVGGGPEKDNKFISKILPHLKADEPVTAVHDKCGSLTCAKELAIFIVQSLRSGLTGIKHFSSSDYCSRFDIAQFIAGYIDSKSIMTKVDSQMFPLSAPRPMSEALYTLSPKDFQEITWHEVIKGYLKEWL